MNTLTRMWLGRCGLGKFVALSTRLLSYLSNTIHRVHGEDQVVIANVRILVGSASGITE